VSRRRSGAVGPRPTGWWRRAAGAAHFQRADGGEADELTGSVGVSRATFQVRSKGDGRHLHRYLDAQLLKLGDRDKGLRSLELATALDTIK